MGLNDAAAEPPADVKDAHTTGRMSARSERIELITRGERRRHLLEGSLGVTRQPVAKFARELHALLPWSWAASRQPEIASVAA